MQGGSGGAQVPLDRRGVGFGGRSRLRNLANSRYKRCQIRTLPELNIYRGGGDFIHGTVDEKHAFAWFARLLGTACAGHNTVFFRQQNPLWQGAAGGWRFPPYTLIGVARKQGSHVWAEPGHWVGKGR